MEDKKKDDGKVVIKAPLGKIEIKIGEDKKEKD